MLVHLEKKIKSIARFIYERFLKVSFIILDIVLLKKNNYWCFCTWGDYPHTLDNPRAVFEAVKNDVELHKIVLVRTKDRLKFVDGKNVKFVNVESFRGGYYTARCKVILLGYSLQGLSSYSNLISNRHYIIQLWHGIPLKKIGMLFPGETFWYKETKKYSATVCSSVQDKEIMAQAFSPIQEENVWQCGLPRNDTILMDEELLPDDYRVYLEKLKKQLAGRKLVLYAPTWRIDTSNIYEFTKQEIEALTHLLDKNSAVLGVRSHSNVRSHELMDDKLSNDRIIDANSIPDVSLILRVTDVLITDYSSIYIDFLITDRPILHFTYDLESYYKERGFLYNIEEAFASEKILNFSVLIDKLEESLQVGVNDVPCYQGSKRLFHDYKGSSSVTVVDNIKKLCVNK